MRLFCFTFAGGTSAAFFGWNKRFGDRLDVCPVEYPGRGKRWKEPPCITLENLVQTLTTDLRAYLDEPYAVLGHSFGAIVAFEFARLAHGHNWPMPVRLVLSAVRAPQLPNPENIHGLPEPEFLARLNRYEGIPREVLENKETFSLLLPIVRNDFKLYETYKFHSAEPLPVPISVLGGMQDRNTPVPDLLAWTEHTTKSFRSHFFPGKHFFLFEPQCRAFDNIYRDIEVSIVQAAQGAAHE